MRTRRGDFLHNCRSLFSPLWIVGNGIRQSSRKCHATLDHRRMLTFLCTGIDSGIIYVGFMDSRASSSAVAPYFVQNGGAGTCGETRGPFVLQKVTRIIPGGNQCFAPHGKRKILHPTRGFRTSPAAFPHHCVAASTHGTMCFILMLPPGPEAIKPVGLSGSPLAILYSLQKRSLAISSTKPLPIFPDSHVYF